MLQSYLGLEPVSGINSLAVRGAAERYGGRSGPTSQREHISPSPHRLWACVDRYLGRAAPAMTLLHPCICLSVPWQQQLVKNVSVSGWGGGGESGQPGSLEGYGWMCVCVCAHTCKVGVA